MPSKCCHGATTGLTFLVVLLLVVATAAPLWVWLYDGDEYVGVGLFNRIGLDPQGDLATPINFQLVKFQDDDTRDKDHWMAMTILFALSCAMAVVAFVVLIAYSFLGYKSRQSKLWYLTLLISMVISWLCSFGGVMVFLAFHGDTLTKSRDISDSSFSWSFLLCVLGTILEVMLTIVVAIKYRPAKSNAIPAALDSKIPMYPTTKTGFENDVFQGMPYSTNHNGASSFTDMGEGSQFDQPLGILPPEDNFNDRRNLIHTRPRELDSPRGAMSFNQVQRSYSTSRAGPPSLGNDLVVYTGKQQPQRLQRESPEFIYAPETNRNVGMLGKNEFLVTARHGQDRDPHRDKKTYLSHTSMPDASGSNGQRLVLSPANFSEGNVKYNPSLMYKPVSDHVY